MGKAHIIVRARGADGRWRAAKAGETGERRYLVRWRVAGRDSRLRHGGSFATRRAAQARERYIEDELAAGRMPDVRPGLALETAPSVEQLIREHLAARVDVGEGTRRGFEAHVARLPAELRALAPVELTAGDLQRWVNRATGDGKVGASSIARTVGILRAALERAGVEPNPAGRLTLPVYRAPEITPPSAAALLALVALLPDHWCRVVCAIEGSGMRVSEAARLLGRDVDRERGRILVRRERTKRTPGGAGERWIPLRPATLALIRAPRTPDSRVLGFDPSSLRAIMRDRTDERRINPKGLRHRHASRLVAQGLPITIVRERMGHSRASMTLDVYSHVLLDDDLDPALDLADLLTRSTGLV